jgi:hypothetical protein
VPGGSVLADSHRGSEAVGRFLAELHKVFVSAESPFESSTRSTAALDAAERPQAGPAATAASGVTTSRPASTRSATAQPA